MMNTANLRIVLVQENPTVGDIDGNLNIVRRYRKQYIGKADLLVFPECFATGYPLQDLVGKPGFLRSTRAAIEEFSAEMASTEGPAVIVGAPIAGADKPFNAAIMIDIDGSQTVVKKHVLPNDEVYDEVRTFEAGPVPKPIWFRGFKVGLAICEDFWHGHVSRALADEGADFLCIINGSHFRVGKQDDREEMAKRVARTNHLPVLYVNQVCGQDDLVFDGGSFATHQDGTVIARAAFRTATIEMVIEKSARGISIESATQAFVEPYPCKVESLYSAMVLGLRDYVNKTGFPGIIIGMSGGLDSALSAAVAVDTLGAERVRCVMMPSKYTSQESLDDAAAASEMLGAQYDIIPIEGITTAFGEALAPIFEGREEDITEENIQARARGDILMAISNKLGHMVLSTGNKSEMSVGYATLYGDMCGGYSVLKDLYKTLAFEVSAWRNENVPAAHLMALGPKGPVMPQNIIDKKPSAELKPDQVDEDSLGSYEDLDAVLGQLIEETASPELAAALATETLGHEVTVEYATFIAGLLNRAQYKRYQAPPGVSLTETNHGQGRRFPIVNKFKG